MYFIVYKQSVDSLDDFPGSVEIERVEVRGHVS